MKPILDALKIHYCSLYLLQSGSLSF